jgi:hypothetical protein
MLIQAAEVAKHEGAVLRAIYTSADVDGNREAVPTLVQQLYDQVVSDAGIEGRLAADAADWNISALERARWNNLIIAPIYSTGKQKIADDQWRLRWRDLLINSARPVLAVSDKPFDPQKCLLVYTGDSKDQQALAVSAWLASQWDMSLTVGIGGDPSERNNLIDYVETYLARYGIVAQFEAKHVDSPAEILKVTHRSDYSLIVASIRQSVWSRILSSTRLDIIDLLQDTKIPILILN